MAEVGFGNCTELVSEFREVAIREDVGIEGAFTFWGHGAVLLGHRMVVLGGAKPELQNKVFFFDLLEEVWSASRVEGTNLVKGLAKLCFLCDDQIYSFVYVGSTAGSRLSRLDSVLLDELQPLPLGPIGLDRKIVAYFETSEEIVVFDGPEVLIFKVESSTWRSCATKGESPTLATLPRNQIPCVSETSIYYSSLEWSMTMYELNMKTMTWSTLSSGSSNTKAFTATLTYIQGRIFVFGGSMNARERHAYSVSEDRWHRLSAGGHGEGHHDLRMTGDDFEYGYVHHTALHWNGNLIVLGGFTGDSTFGKPLYIRPSA